jgi:hypothetical protein
MKTLVHDGMSSEQAVLVSLVEAHIEQAKMRAQIFDMQIELERVQEIATRNINERYRLERMLSEIEDDAS